MNKWKHAVVAGGSIGGMLAARVLSDYFEKVTVLDKDTFPKKPVVRKLTPQANHLHILLNKGIDILEEFFPGIIRDLQDMGESYLDASKNVAWFFHGSWRPRFNSGINFFPIFRPGLDWLVHKRLLKDCPNVVFKDKVEITDFLSGPDKSRITGVSAKKNGPNGQRFEIEANLVVDATGRNSKTPVWLESMGYKAPEEKEIKIDVSYTTRIYNAPKTFNEDWKLFVVYSRFPENWRSGAINSVKDNKWLVTLFAYFNDRAPLDDAGFLKFARTLPRRELYEKIKNEKPISPTLTYKIPHIRRRYYEKLSRFPDGVVVIGDANCVFNPIFGQGISAVALYCAALRKNLENFKVKRGGDLSGFPLTFQRSLPKSLDLPWFITNMIDLSYKQCAGYRPPGMKLISWYLSRTLESVSRSPRLYKMFLRVMHLRDGWNVLLNPFFSFSVLLYGVKSFFIPLEKRANSGEAPRI